MRTLLLDSNYLCHRALYTMGSLSNRNEPTGVIYGFLMQLKTLSEQFNTKKLVFCWDSKNSKRKEICPTYKGTRKDVDEETKQKREEGYIQFNLLRDEIIPSMGFRNNFYYDGYEADDIMANVTMYYERDFLMVTADNDMFQILDFTDMFSPVVDKFYSYESFKAEWGIRPEQWAIVKALAGCESDNVEGLPKVGYKTAVKYLLGGYKPNKTFQMIKDRYDEMMERNLKIVQLPFKDTPIPNLTTDCLNYNNFVKMAENYNFKSFINDKQTAIEWREWFDSENNKSGQTSIRDGC